MKNVWSSFQITISQQSFLLQLSKIRIFIRIVPEGDYYSLIKAAAIKKSKVFTVVYSRPQLYNACLQAKFNWLKYLLMYTGLFILALTVKINFVSKHVGGIQFASYLGKISLQVGPVVIGSKAPSACIFSLFSFFLDVHENLKILWISMLLIYSTHLQEFIDRFK